MRFTSSMMRQFRREGPPLLHLRRVLSVPLAPFGVGGAFVAPIVVFSLPVGLVDHETGWVRVAGILGALLTSTVCVLAAWALASEVRQRWRRGVVDVDSIAYMCGFGLTPLVIGLVCYAEGIGAAG